ncbi:Potassium-transporting ATPase A chain (plasmid) [Acidithiobacillus caldus ATCC 51756]|uniref:Potassium-transporting ATPase A chain n=1 Tax=Acidithiobacillus caldus (strain ATCC 51756 / DSM 8584 / KU) TaxID=637389 RepID=A0A059ZYW2_ACICK|nr:Potassium-transporting ATPase A chain [Acidithiobacillus caldus ATCC 51756]
MHPLLASVLQTLFVLGLTILLAYPLGIYLDSVYNGRVFWARRVLGPIEEMIYHLAGSAPGHGLETLRSQLFGLQRARRTESLRPVALARGFAFQSGTLCRHVAHYGL